MDDYLRKMCTTLGVKLIYTNNKFLVLTAEIKDNVPVIRAHKIFKHCPQSVAQSVINYFTDSEGRSIHEKVIEEYLKQNFSSDTFSIEPLNLDFKNKVAENMPFEIDVNDDSMFKELDIADMIVKDVWGNEKKHDSNSPLVPDSNEILELDVIIKPPFT